MKKHIVITERVWEMLKGIADEHKDKTGRNRSIGEQAEILIEECIENRARIYEGQ